MMRDRIPLPAPLLQDAEARNMGEAACDHQEEKQSLEWLASNMVSWLSQRITVEESEWARVFEQAGIEGHWAYQSRIAGERMTYADRFAKRAIPLLLVQP